MRNTGPDLNTRHAVIFRDDFTCRRCGRTPGSQIHHRCPRKSGGSRRSWVNGMANLVLLCLDCHAYVESNRTEAYASGFLVREGQDLPESVPLIDTSGRRFFLTDSGSVIGERIAS